jgi:hypothetical protein
MEFSHLATSFIIVTANIFIGIMVVVLWQLGASIDLQVYLVILLAFAFTACFYFYMRYHRRNRTVFFQRMCSYGRQTHLSLTPFWQFLAKVADSEFLAGKASVKKDRSASQQKNRPDPRILE